MINMQSIKHALEKRQMDLLGFQLIIHEKNLREIYFNGTLFVVFEDFSKEFKTFPVANSEKLDYRIGE